MQVVSLKQNIWGNPSLELLMQYFLNNLVAYAYFKVIHELENQDV